MEILSRTAAKAAGLLHYFTGKPCKRGHIDKRFVSSFWCMACAREKAKKDWDNADADWKQRRSQYQKRRWQDPEFRQKIEKYKPKAAEYRKRRKAAKPNEFKDLYAKNRERRKQQANAWYHANTERALQAQKEYYKRRPELRRAHGRRSANTRRARKLLVFVEAIDAGKVFDRDNGICGICKRAVDMTSPWEVDHIIPISKGGAHAYANVQLAHRKCNRSKSAKLLVGQPTLFQVVPR